MPSRRAGQTNPAVGENHQKVIRAAAERLARSGVTLYAIDARGIYSPADDLASRQYAPSAVGIYQEVAAAAAFGGDSRAGFDLLTTITGGRFIFGTNDFSQAIRKATADLHGSYSLGFYPRDPQPPGWRKLQVSVRRPGVTLLHPSGFSLDAPAGEFGPETLRLAMLNPLGSSAIRLNAHCRHASRDQAGAVDLVAQVDADDLLLQQKDGRFVGRLDVYVGEKTAEGGLALFNSAIRLNFTAQQWADARAKGLPYRRSWKLGPKAVVIRLLVREPGTGRTGVVDIPVSRIAPPPGPGS
ncbi:MAG: hypothetical protein HY858_04385 [Candidatus Solibacter usitatus]|nr:hypothetical protein [Candidatus Solibacter usitatus]